MANLNSSATKKNIEDFAKRNKNLNANKTITVNGLDEKTLYKNEKGDVYTGEKIHRQGIELELIDGLYAFDYFKRVKNS